MIVCCLYKVTDSSEYSDRGYANETMVYHNKKKAFTD